MACLMLLMTRRANMRNFLRPTCTEPTRSIGAVAWEGVAPPCPIPHQAAQLQMFAIKKRLQPTSSTSWEVPNNRCSPAHRVPGLRTLHAMLSRHASQQPSQTRSPSRCHSTPRGPQCGKTFLPQGGAGPSTIILCPAPDQEAQPTHAHMLRMSVTTLYATALCESDSGYQH
jgi:hypothetical protein